MGRGQKTLNNPVSPKTLVLNGFRGFPTEPDFSWKIWLRQSVVNKQDFLQVFQGSGIGKMDYALKLHDKFQNMMTGFLEKHRQNNGRTNRRMDEPINKDLLCPMVVSPKSKVILRRFLCRCIQVGPKTSEQIVFFLEML